MRALILAASLLLASCGFHLQGRTPLPPLLERAYVQADDRQSDFVQGLRKALLASGAQLADRPEDASAVVQILTDQVTERVLSVSASNLPREYELTHTVRFAVLQSGEELLPVQEVEATRDMTFDERTLLAKEREQAILREALARDLVGMVMRRLSSL